MHPGKLAGRPQQCLRQDAKAVAIVLAVFLDSAVASDRFALASHGGSDTRHRSEPSTVAQQPVATTIPLATFEATGLPEGPAIGTASYTAAPSGWELKHVYGGAVDVYVPSGYIDLVESDGPVTTYQAGEFVWEPPGHVHTARTPEGTTWFTLRIRPPGVLRTIPVQ
ncbi:MAG TPA: hypothetical protein VFD32_06665 [Dehalococcoidia bacterium]|nr:hypothetical protein [Dehalococcoidia bacterium]